VERMVSFSHSFSYSFFGMRSCDLCELSLEFVRYRYEQWCAGPAVRVESQIWLAHVWLRWSCLSRLGSAPEMKFGSLASVGIRVFNPLKCFFQLSVLLF